MYINDIFQLNVFLLSVGFGFLLAVLYDILSVILGAFSNKTKVIFLKDLIYCFMSAIMLFIYLLAVNFGRIRIFIIFGIVIGYICWFIMLRENAAKLINIIIAFLSRVFRISAFTISLPVRPFIALRSKLWGKIKRFFQKKFKK